MSYLVFLFLLAGAVFFGLPLPGTLRIASSALLGNMASLATGLMPALKSRCFAVKYVISSSSAISRIVKYSPFSFIILLSENVSERLKNAGLLNRRIVKLVKKVKKIVFFRYFYIDINVSLRYNYNISELTPLHRAGRAPIGANAVKGRGSNRRFLF